MVELDEAWTFHALLRSPPVFQAVGFTFAVPDAVFAVKLRRRTVVLPPVCEPPSDRVEVPVVTVVYTASSGSNTWPPLSVNVAVLYESCASRSVDWSGTLSVVGVALLLSVCRLVLGPHAQDRILALDTLYVNAMLLLLAHGIRTASTVYFETTLLIGLLGFGLLTLSRADLRVRPKDAVIGEAEIEDALSRRKAARANA